VSDAIHGDDKSDHAESLSLQKALYITCFAAAIGSACLFAASLFINFDEHQVELYIQQHDNEEDDAKEKEPLLSTHDKSKQSSIKVYYSVNNDEIIQK